MVIKETLGSHSARQREKFYFYRRVQLSFYLSLPLTPMDWFGFTIFLIG
jgi:hypothetical protein